MYLTPTYWLLGWALELVHAKLTVRQFGHFLQEHGIHKVRASKARAIARFYSTPEELAGVSVQDAYQAAIKTRREQESSHSDNSPEVGGETDLPEDTTIHNDATPVTAALSAINARLERLTEDVVAKGIGPDETYAQVVS